MSDIQKYNVWNKSKLSEYCKQKKLNVKLLSKIIQIFCSTTTTKLWKISRKHKNFLGSKFFLSLNFSFLPTSISNFRSFVYNKKKKNGKSSKNKKWRLFITFTDHAMQLSFGIKNTLHELCVQHFHCFGHFYYTLRLHFSTASITLHGGKLPDEKKIKISYGWS